MEVSIVDDAVTIDVLGTTEFGSMKVSFIVLDTTVGETGSGWI